MATKHITTKPKKAETVVNKEKRKVLGVTANIRNTLIAIAMIFAFLGGFFKVYEYIENRYAKQNQFTRLESRFDHKEASDVLNAMYSRMWTLDNMITMSPDQSKVPVEIKTEYNDLKAKIKLQEEKVKVLQEKLCK